MIELAPRLELADIELEGGLSLIPHSPEYPGCQAFTMWDGEAIVGGVALTPDDEATAQVWIDESLIHEEGYLPKAIQALSQYAFGGAGCDRLVITVATDDAPAIKTLGKLGFRLATVNNAATTLGFELYADKDKVSHPPLRVDLDKTDDTNRLTP